MRSFLEQYGTAIFTLVFVAILIAFAGPIGSVMKQNTNTQIQHVDEIGTIAIRDRNRPPAPTEAVNEVYCILYDDNELVISQNEIEPEENRTVINKGYFSIPKDVDTTEGKTHIQTVRFEDAVKPKSCVKWFGEWKQDENKDIGCTKLTNIIHIENLYTNECVTMNQMFYNCQALTTIDVSNFNTKKVKDIQSMFYHCQKLKNLNVSYFDTKNVIYMNAMFDGCNNLLYLDLSNWDINNIKYLYQIFNSISLKEINLTNWNMDKVQSVRNIFYNGSNLTTITCSSSTRDKLLSFSNSSAPPIDSPIWNIQD